MSDNVSIWEGDQKQERERVIQKAEEKGVERRDIEIVIRLHKKGKNPDEISDLTGLSVERIAEIIENQKDK